MSAAPKTKPAKVTFSRTGAKKRTSIGGNARPTNKSARRAHKPYRGQGRV